MKKLVALLLVALFLLSLPLVPSRADGEEPPAKPSDSQGSGESTEGDGLVETAHNKPRRSKSLKYWEQEFQEIALTGKLREDILIIAQSQVGYSADASCYEETSSGKKRFYTRYGEWYGSKYSDWCDTFVSFCIYYAGNESYPFESSCARHMKKLKRLGYWREWNSYVPRKGDIVFFAISSKSGAPTHVGLVEEVIPPKGDTAGQLITIEGNQRNPKGSTPCVRRMERSMKDVVGYGTYEQGKTYPEGNSIRSNGWTIIDENSRYFVEYPTLEAMRFLGFLNTRYYDYWFADAQATPAPEAETGPTPELTPASETRLEPTPVPPSQEGIVD